MKTTDGGNSWNQLGSFPGTIFNDLCFPTKNKGFACASNAIYRTTEAGLHWDMIYSGPVSYDRMQFTDSLNGYVMGANWGFNRMLFKTADGGITWSEKPVDQTCSQLNDLFFKDPENGFIVGYDGVILKTGNSGGIITGIKPGIRTAASEIAIYPNPCSDRINIQFPGIKNSVEIHINSVLGKEVFSSEYRRVQEISITLPRLPSGTYLVRIETDSEVFVKKLVVDSTL